MCHTHVPDTAGRKAKGWGQSVDLIFVGLRSYLQITPTTGFTSLKVFQRNLKCWLTRETYEFTTYALYSKDKQGNG